MSHLAYSARAFVCLSGWSGSETACPYQRPGRSTGLTLRIRSLLYFLLVLLGLPHAAFADEVRLTNGDRLTGKVVKLDEGSLTLATTYAGDIKIDWKEVQSVITEAPVTLELQDESQLRGYIVITESGQVSIADPGTEETTTVARDAITAINPPPDLRYKGELNAGGNVTSGNTDTQAINASTRWDIRTDHHEFLVEARYNYGERGTEVIVRNARGAFNYAYFLTKKGKWFLNVEELLEQDTFQRLEIRSTTSGGVGYRFFDTSRNKLALSTRAAFVVTQFQDRSADTIPSSNWKLVWEYWVVPDHVQFFHRQQGFQDFGDESTAFRWNADQGFHVPVYNGLYLNLEYDFRFNSEPDSGRKETDQAIIFGVGWKVEN